MLSKLLAEYIKCKIVCLTGYIKLQLKGATRIGLLLLR